MRSGINRLVALTLAALVPAAPTTAQSAGPVRHELVIHHFRTESGAVLPEARVVYGTYGMLDAAGDNAVLLPSHYMADLTGYGFLIGPGKALDPSKLFLITTEMFGNGRSSSPSNTPEPLNGPRFPAITIRDDVAASRAVLDALHVRHLKAVIGFSMGAEQAFQWAVSYPSFMDRVVATSGTARAWGHGIVRLEGQIAALTTDPAFKAGDYGNAEPERGIQAFSLVWAGWLYSQEWWRRELWRGDTPALTSLPQAIDRYRHVFDGNDANDLILQARTWEAHDVGRTPEFGGDTIAALRSIRVPVLYMPSATDLYFPLEDARYECGFIRTCLLYPIPSLWGHPAGAGATPADAAFINNQVARYMAGALDQPNATTLPRQAN
nr:alpha/beta fold hydrolase [Sphingomonas sp. CROZ-RG-20F-R02-07]